MSNLPKIDIIQACRDPRLIGDEVSPGQELILRAINGLKLPERKIETRFFRDGRFVREMEFPIEMFQRCTGRERWEEREFSESGIYPGRRSGKTSKIASNQVVYEANFRPHKIDLGDEPEALIISRTKKQARKAYKHVLERQRRPSLAGQIVGPPRKEEYDLVNKITVGVWPCNQESTQGVSAICIVADELAYWADDSGANPARSVIDAVTPGLSTHQPHGKLIKISTQHSKSGLVWDDVVNRATRPDVLVWVQPSWELNPRLSDEFLIGEFRRDEDLFFRTYGTRVAESVNQLLPPELVDACVERGMPEFAPRPGFLYVCALDPSSKGDDFAMAIAHADGPRIFVDYVRAWRAPGRGRYIDYNSVLAEVVATMRRYGAPKAFSDQVSAAAISAELGKASLGFEQTVTYGTKAGPKFQTLRQKVISGELALPDNEVLIGQLKRLEEILAEGGRSTVEARAGKDDLAIAVAAAVHHAALDSEFEPYALCIDLPGSSQSFGLSSPAPALNAGPSRPVPTEPLHPDDCGPERWWSRF